MSTRKVDLEKVRKKAKQPGAGHPINIPPKDPVVQEKDRLEKELRKPPAQRKKKSWV